MLRHAPESDPRTRLLTEEDDRVFCAACGRELSRYRWRIVARDAHEHTVFNPAGLLFRVLCFRDAPGLAVVSEASEVFSWFPGYAWRVGACAGCREHVGWRFEATSDGTTPAIFFGLIKDRLSDGRPAGTP